MRRNLRAKLADELQKAAARETAYQHAKTKALAQLSAPFRLGGRKMPLREDLHDRPGHREITQASA